MVLIVICRFITKENNELGSKWYGKWTLNGGEGFLLLALYHCYSILTIPFSCVYLKKTKKQVSITATKWKCLHILRDIHHYND